MNRERQRMQTLKQCRGGSVQKFVANAKDPARQRRARPLPAPLRHDLLQRDAISRAAPRCYDHLRIEPPNVFGRHLATGSAHELPSCGLDEFRDPWSATQSAACPIPHTRLWAGQCGGPACTDLADGALHGRDHFCLPRSVAPTAPAMVAISV